MAVRAQTLYESRNKPLATIFVGGIKTRGFALPPSTGSGIVSAKVNYPCGGGVSPP
jgi:hypothetical protein